MADGTVCDAVVAAATTKEQNVPDAVSQPADALLVYFSHPRRGDEVSEVFMVTDLFGALLQELSHALGVPNLQPDSNNSCLLRLQSGLIIQIELDKSGQAIVIGADLGTVPPGKYRENLFREALKANAMPPPLHGILCYSRKSDHLVLFQRINIKDLNGEKVEAEITPFAEKAFTWSEALLRNEIPALNQSFTSRKPGGMFGLMQ